MINTDGATFNPDDPPIYFLASNVDRQQWGVLVHNHMLVAVNELSGDRQFEYLDQVVDQGKYLFIDSGIFNLTMEHARRHDVRMDQALALAPNEIDGFDELYEKYLGIVRRYADRCWGYIELDQGGREHKIKTRAKLEELGLRPIPVYHPLNDGWDYFDYLAERYDRICLGNIVQADPATRRKLLHTIWERHRRYPDLWIHGLGYTPNAWANALPINSSDSSTWLAAIRWPTGYAPQAMQVKLGNLPKDFQYVLSGDPASEVGSRKSVRMIAYGSHMQERCLRCHWANLQEIGFERFPPPGD